MPYFLAPALYYLLSFARAQNRLLFCYTFVTVKIGQMDKSRGAYTGGYCIPVLARNIFLTRLLHIPILVAHLVHGINDATSSREGQDCASEMFIP